MQKQNDIHDNRHTDWVWYFLAEFSLSKDMIAEDLGGDLTAGFLFQATQELCIPQAFLKRIERSLIGFAKEAMAVFNQDKPDSPVHFRLFCQRKQKEDLSSELPSSQYKIEPALDFTQMNRYPDTKNYGGWGFFLIEREGGVTPGSSESSNNLIDLYLYKEVE